MTKTHLRSDRILSRLVSASVVTSALLLTACQSEPPEPVGTQFYQFAEQPSARDVPAVELHHEALSALDDHYFRFVGDYDATDFFMARTATDEPGVEGLCLIAVEQHTAEVQCAGPAELDPMVVQLAQPVEAFLIPDDTTAQLPEGWKRIRRNLVVVTDPETAPDHAEVLLPDQPFPTEAVLQR